MLGEMKTFSFWRGQFFGKQLSITLGSYMDSGAYKEIQIDNVMSGMEQDLVRGSEPFQNSAGSR
jgi:hypothetical protein